MTKQPCNKFLLLSHKHIKVSSRCTVIVIGINFIIFNKQIILVAVCSHGRRRRRLVGGRLLEFLVARGFSTILQPGNLA